ncbi:FAD-dependent oxidoreductase [Neptunicoccus cionae]|uniref:Glucose-methanol-choline oxidoreductase n=1 Tax=Neptunicoccus cionae TaxID=2035344 RepID=A0A916R2R4_9RHOB|nr:GMC family oxidoreductase [Amylibacter cionae]GGA29678.1 glucose-methanol-choline oxidoreductase [Amylibacter cionae]
MKLQQAQTRSWDVIVIGAGMGGGIAARRLAEQGLSVLIVEKGPQDHPQEQQGLNQKMLDPVARRVRSFWPTQIEATLNGRTSRSFAALGCGVGGSSVFYAGALERPERHDLEDTPAMPHPTGGWPVGYDDFAPYYAQAEDILHIAGENDPLSTEAAFPLKTPVPISADEQQMMDRMAKNGLHPYRLPLSIRHIEGCMMCIGHKCPRRCKMDGRSAGIEPALATGHATLLTDCDATALVYDDKVVTGVKLTQDGQDAILCARFYVLAAGGYGSPRLLLRSQGPNPAGCANSSDWVGRGLMFHLNELFVLWPQRKHRFKGASKAISLRDLYSHKGERFGVIQSVGLEASFGNIATFLCGIYDRSVLRHIPRLRYPLTNIPALIAARMLGDAKVFSAIMEDLPYPDNRVVLNENDPDVPTFQYTIPDEMMARWRAYRRRIRKAFAGHRRLMTGMAPQLNFGHPCGTLRFGHDPATSVLDASCKTHDLNNLYVTDSSFFPTSLGVNPSLTIAANSLRVGDIIVARAKSETPDEL